MAVTLDPRRLLGVTGARLLTIAVALLVLLAVLRLGFLLLAGPAVPMQPSGFVPASGAAVAATDAGVARWHLFGESGAAIDLMALAHNAPETSLKLILRGTFNLESHEDGIAIISDEGGEHRRYKVGDELPGGARLEAISAGRVLLSRNGVTEGLSLPRDAQAQVAGAGAGSAAPGAGAPAPRAPSTAPPVMPFINPVIASGAPSMESIREATGIDAAALASQVQVFPVLENGRFAGVRLAVGRDSELFSRTGLKPTDILTAVNGIPLDGPQRQSELMSSLRDARSLRLTVRRDGAEQQIGVDLK
jgi:general secretion pathway protein C